MATVSMRTGPGLSERWAVSSKGKRETFDSLPGALEAGAALAAYYGEPLSISTEAAARIGGWNMLRADGVLMRSVGCKPVPAAE